MQPKFDVFISHSTIDKEFADPLWKSLEKLGHSCWIAPHSIYPSEQWPTAIRRGVRDSRILVLLVSLNSEASSEVLTELNLASKFKVPISPIRLEIFESENLYHYIWNVQDIDTTQSPYMEQVESIANEISQILELRASNDAVESRPAVTAVTLPTEDEIKAEIASPSTERKSNSNLQRILTARGPGRENKIYTAIRAGDTDIEAVDRFGQMALHYVARAKTKLASDPEQRDVLRLLLLQNPPLNAVTVEGNTPLHLASQ